tara:strand:+ start:391 stop:612 length:222 start_codon:yes stop_codon:yes gene_type:complete
MINEFISMNGYGSYVWGAFAFTLINFTVLYLLIKVQLIRERKKFEKKYLSLSTEKVELAKKQSTYRELLQNSI